ncbi:hypothetical protein [Breznakiella homolactica]|uniref:Zinc ribbon domain-containing protein n=1 Tax=Breznakiella homolactica TaxID=2798577 RepID=A0A7T7XR86_9SPIR|nr:hypothetical protein [Breznakiella homolactica]QQO10974.1 hypothetical protein JFL75_08665 [Breznakiella homolactica]
MNPDQQSETDEVTYGESDVRLLEESLNSMESELHEKYCRIGKEILETVENENRNISTLVDMIIETRRRLASARQEKKCPSCLSFNDRDSLFCKRCGKPLTGDNKEKLQ